MSAENNSSADSADIGEALVAALGFEPTEGRKRRGGSGAANEEEPSVDDAFTVVASDSSVDGSVKTEPVAEADSDVASATKGLTDLKALAQPAVTVVNGDNGADSKSSSDSKSDADSKSAIDSKSATESKSGNGSGGQAADDNKDRTQSGQSRKSKRRRNRNTASDASKKAQGPAKMADKPASSAKDAESGADDNADGAADNADDGRPAPSKNVTAKVDAITADAVKAVAEKSQADIDLDKAWEESQAEAKAETIKSEAVANAKTASKSSAEVADGDDGKAAGNLFDSAAAKTAADGSSDDGPMANAAAVTGDITDIIKPNDQPPPPSAGDAIKVLQPAPGEKTPATATSSNVDEFLADSLTEVPSAPPAMPSAPVAEVDSVTKVDSVAKVDSAPTKEQQTPSAKAAPKAEAAPAEPKSAPAKAEAAPSAPPTTELPKRGLEVKEDEIAAVAAAKLEAAKPSSGFGFSLPNALRRKRRVQARKVRRVIRHIDPWSVLTFSVLFHLSVFAALLLASVLVWNAAEAAGTIENMEAFILDLGDYETFEIKGDVVFRAAVAIAGILTLASSVLLVLLTVVFNLISDLVGGIRLTVIEEETVRVRRKKTN